MMAAKEVTLEETICISYQTGMGGNCAVRPAISFPRADEEISTATGLSLEIWVLRSATYAGTE